MPDPKITDIVREAVRQANDRHVTEAMIVGGRHFRPVVRVRHRIIAAIRHLRPDLSLARIGLSLSMHHTAIVYGMGRADEVIRSDRTEAALFESLIGAFPPPAAHVASVMERLDTIEAAFLDGVDQVRRVRASVKKALEAQPL